MSVQVAVRVRPFNQREKELNSECIVQMEGQKTSLQHPDPKKQKDFSFDFSFWSHDGFEIDENGNSIPTDERYADQRQVYEAVGTQILDNAWEGYNCCLFAYGQTGAGKSYSMVGYKPNIGIVPIACQEIFKRIERNENDNVTYEVFCSMQEIYNEKVQDLLVPISKRPSGGLKIRENKTIGFFVDGLTKYPVDSYEQIEQIMDDGSKNRTIASTQMNASSSRAHTIITIEFKQIEQTEDKKFEKLSVINLVDLAGSEKVGKTGATGDRLKEAGQINKSLSTLGLVISTLVDVQSGKKGVKVPYRDSCLTKILANALGGNSKTLMICAISPALDNYEESLSTLRYADQAKKIKNKAIVNESATDKLIRELNSELDELRKKMEFFNNIMSQNNIDITKVDITKPENMKGTFGGQLKEMLDIQADMQANQNLMADANKDFKQKKTDMQKMGENFHFQEIDTSKPYICNLNEDPQLSKKIQYSLAKEKTYVGKKNGNPTPDIIINAMGMKENHAIFTFIDNKVFLEPVEKECSEYMFLNGDKVQEKIELKEQDRIIFGTNSSFLVYIPGGAPRQDDLPKDIDWEFAQQEMTSKFDKIKKKEEEQELERQQKILHEEMQLKLDELEKKNNAEKQRQEEERMKKEEEYQLKIKELQDQKERQEIEKQREQEKQEFEKQRIQQELEEKNEKLKIQEEEAEKKNKIKEKNHLTQRLQRILPRIVEVNLFAKELKRQIYLEPKIQQVLPNGVENNAFDKSSQMRIFVKVYNKEEGTVYKWDDNKFSNRYWIIKELINKFFETNDIPQLDNTQDPFWDPPEPELIGYTYYHLMPLAYLMDNPFSLNVAGITAKQGTIKINIIPTDEKGQINLGEELQDDADMLEDPNELVGRRLDFLMCIEQLELNDPYKNIFVEYKIMDSNKKIETFRTQTIQTKENIFNFNYIYHHHFLSVDDEILDYLQNKQVFIKIFGEEEIEKESKQYQSKKAPQQALEESQETLNPNDLATDSQIYQQKQQNISNQYKVQQHATKTQGMQNNQDVYNAQQIYQGNPQNQQSNQQTGQSKKNTINSNTTTTTTQNSNGDNKSKKKGKNGNCVIF